MIALRSIGILVAFFGFAMFALQTSCNCGPHEVCGKVTAKVWSFVTGDCYVIAQNTAWPSQTVYIECDTLDWPGIEIGELYCGQRLDTQ